MISVVNRARFNVAVEGITHGVQLTSSNTGVPSGTSQTTQSTSGGTIPAGDYVGKVFPDPSPDGWYTLANGPATFTDCTILGGLVVDTANDGALTRCDIQGGFSGSTSHRWAVADCHFTDPGGDFVHLTGDSPAGTFCDDWTFTRCLFDGIVQANVVEGAHLDGIQTRGVRRLLLDMCAWRMGAQWTHYGDPLPLNAAVFFENANGGTVDVELRDSYLDGSTSVLFLQPFTGHLRITGNRWGPLASGERVRNDSAVTPTAWSGNVIDADDTPLTY